MDVYDPAEDSFLLKRCMAKLARGEVLEVGTGSGIVAIEAAKHATSVTAIDINPKAIASATQAAQEAGVAVKFIQSDLFSKLKGRRFDTIISNPPYLPSSKAFPDVALDGGDKGYEFIFRLLDEAPAHLKEGGTLAILFSSLSKPREILKRAGDLLLDFQLIDQEHVFFEDLYVYAFRRSALREELERQGIKGIHLFAHGKRGNIFVGEMGKVKVAVKTARTPQFETQVQREASYLKRLNKLGIGPKFLFEEEGFFAYRFVEGTLIGEYVAQAKRPAILKLIKEVFSQCRALDKAGINKLEMTRPVKHIIITAKRKPVMIDFEKCHPTQDPKNVTQFAQFLMAGDFALLLAQRGIKAESSRIIPLCKKYKDDPTELNFRRIVSAVS